MKIVIGFLICAIGGSALAGGYHYNYNNIAVVKQKIVEFDDRTYLGLDGYYSVGEQIREKARIEKIAEDIELRTSLKEVAKALQDQNKLSKEGNLKLELLLKVLAGEKVPDPATKPVQPEQPEENPKDESKEEVETTDRDKATEIDTKVYEIVKRDCASCHGKNSESIVLIKDDVLQKPSLLGLIEIVKRVRGDNLHGAARMPKGKAALSDADVKILEDWMFEEVDFINSQKK